MSRDVVVGGRDAYGEVYTDSDSKGNKKLWWQDAGTGPRPIVSRRRPMRFRVGYRAKTRRGVLGSGPSRRYGEWRSTYVVQNHRIKPRKYSDTVIRVRNKRFQQAAISAFARAARNF